MKRLLVAAALLLSPAAWADVPPPGGGCDCSTSTSAGVPLALLGVLAFWATRQK
jgi:MYXO-CTERM domain-containing protein